MKKSFASLGIIGTMLFSTAAFTFVENSSAEAKKVYCASATPELDSCEVSFQTKTVKGRNASSAISKALALRDKAAASQCRSITGARNVSVTVTSVTAEVFGREAGGVFHAGSYGFADCFVTRKAGS